METSSALVKKTNLAPQEPYSFLQASDLFPGLHVFASGLQELLVGQVEGLADGERDLLGLKAARVQTVKFTQENGAMMVCREEEPTHFSLSNTKHRCLLDSESLQMKVKILLSVLSSAQNDILCSWQLCCTSCDTKQIYLRVPGVSVWCFFSTNSTHFWFGLQDLHAVDGDLQLHFGDLLTLWLLDVPLKLNRVKNIYWSAPINTNIYGNMQTGNWKAWLASFW